MSNYRRLISYIYEYEGKAKGRNVGFAKLESRGNQCKISVNVKKIFTGGDAGIYLLIPGGEILLGKMFVRGGAGEFRATVQTDNIGGNGIEMDLCYGLAIHEPEETWRTYRTIWEDEVAYAAEIELTKAKPQEEISVEENAKKIIEEIEEEIADQEKLAAAEKEKYSETTSAIMVKPPAATLKKQESGKVPEPGLPEMPPESVPPKPRSMPPELVPPTPQTPERPEMPPEPPIPNRPEMPPVPNKPDIPSEPPQPRTPVVLPGPMLKTPDSPSMIPVETKREESLPQVGLPGELEGLKLEEEPEVNPVTVWNAFEKAYPKIQAFDSEHGCVILVIKPQDLGLLPREVWVYGNNSFLLHGYYSYRYIILARLENPNGNPRFLLGIPGHCYSNEKYMASMFGFPNFVLSKKQPAGDGRFGYWYTDIQLGALEVNTP